jgi:amino acid adenylation domain-containing protein
MPGNGKKLDSPETGGPETMSAVSETALPELVRHLRKLGVELRAKGDKLLLTAPAGAMTPALQSEIRRWKTELLELLRVDEDSEEERCSPLTFAQQRLWLVDRFAPETAAYNIPQSWLVESAVDIEAFERALDRLAERHQTLRTRIEIRNGEPVQVVMKRVRIPVLFTDLSGDTENGHQKADLKAWLQREGREPFALDRGPLIRFHIFRLAPNCSLVSYNVHHIVADQWSLDVLKQDLAALYLEMVSGVAAQLSPLAFQYADVAEKERESATSRLHEGQLEYWRERLKEMPALLELPFSKARPADQRYAGATHALTLDSQLTHELRQLAARGQTTLYLLMLATFFTLLYRYTGQSDLCVGTPMSGRKMREEEGLIGLFVNMLPLRCSVAPKESFHQLLRRMSETVLTDFEHGDIPFQKLVMELHPQRSPGYSPLFQVMFALNPRRSGDDQEQEETFLGVSKFDLTLQIAERAQTLDAYFEYRTDLFNQTDIERFSEHFVRLLESLVERPDDPLGSLTLLTRADTEAITRWNATGLAFDRSVTLIELFDRQAAASPGSIALCCGALSYTFQELQERANYLAAVLRFNGAGPGTFVALCLDRSADLIVAILAILKSGAAYLPLDPKYPFERVDYMLGDSGARILIAQRDDLGAKLSAGSSGLTVLFARELLSAFAPEKRPSEAGGREEAKAADAAYLIYTSGSTGRPKGVVVEHRNAVALIAWARSYFNADSLRGVLASTSVCFDLSIFEVFLPLSTGYTIVLVEDVLELPKSLLAERVTLVNTVPSAMNTLLHAGLPSSVRTVCMAGEFLPTELVDRVYAAGVERVFDLYGPTETTTYSTCGFRARGTAATIGKPIGNTRIYLLDDNLSQVPPGALGEIFIGGEGVTRGYLDRPEMTAERFVHLPAVEPEGRLYRTGDLARQLQDGSLVFLGRRDQQVKLRGHRIELGEIEAALRVVSGVAQVAVVVQKRETGDVLVAFVEDEERRMDPRTWVEKLRMRLPAYMVPALILPLAALPRTPNGKIDRKALSLVKPPLFGHQRESDEADAPPRDLLEQWLANIWAYRLGMICVGRNAHFFEELGGHSLAAFEIFAEIERRLGVAMMLATLFQAPTVALLAAAIRSKGWNELKHMLLLSPAKAGGAADQVMYRLGAGDGVRLEELRTAGERVMGIGAERLNGSIEECDRLAAEIALFEVFKPALTLDASRADLEAAQRLRSSLIRAGFASVSLRSH